MCAQYLIRYTLQEISERLQAGTHEFLADQISARILPQTLAPVVIQNSQRQLEAMRFSLLPRWSHEPKVKFATHNARLETIDTKATWKDAFMRRHCLVPMSGFVEAIYTGELAGHMIEFQPVQDSILFAAGIWEEWVSKQNGEIIRSFAVITHDPPAFVADVGHDRCPIFLSSDYFDTWLAAPKQSAATLKAQLLENRLIPELCTHTDRALRPGWEKRIKRAEASA